QSLHLVERDATSYLDARRAGQGHDRRRRADQQQPSVRHSRAQLLEGAQETADPLLEVEAAEGADREGRIAEWATEPRCCNAVVDEANQRGRPGTQRRGPRIARVDDRGAAQVDRALDQW